MKNKNTSSEEHPHFTSGEWEGFYIYGMGNKRKHMMDFTLNFKDGQLNGSGSDDVGPFSWIGTYSTASSNCSMIKQYHGRHQVFYQGQADENGIWGTWTLSSMRGGFHIKPKNNERKAEEEEVVETAVEKLEILEKKG